MKRAALIGALVASLAVGSAAMADGRGHDRHDDRREHRGAEHHHDKHGHRDYRVGPAVRGGYYRAPSRYGAYHRPHGYYAHRWVRGERLPGSYYARPYVIADYGGYGLYAPPRGYHWVRVDRDAVLAAVATGIVLETVFHAFH